MQYLASRNTLFNLNNFLDKAALQGEQTAGGCLEKKQQLDAVKLRTNIGCVQKAARGIRTELELTLLPQFKTFKCVRRIKMAAKGGVGGGGVTAGKGRETHSRVSYA